MFNRLVTPDEEKYYYSENTGEKSESELLQKAYDSTERITAKRIVANYIDYSAGNNFKVGKIKRRMIKTYAGIKALIPLDVKIKIKNALMRKNNQ